MDGRMNESTVVKEYEFDEQFIHKIISINDKWIRDCYNIFLHILEYNYVYNFKLTNIGNNKIVISRISDKGVVLLELKKIKKCSRKWLYN